MRVGGPDLYFNFFAPVTLNNYYQKSAFLIDYAAMYSVLKAMRWLMGSDYDIRGNYLLGIQK